MRRSSLKWRSVWRGRCAAGVLCLFALPGCLPPVLTLAGIALDVANGREEVGTGPFGPFSGGPTAIQNRSQGDPVVGEALAQSEQRRVTEECIEQLPAPGPASAFPCGVRLVCLPGGRAPIRLRVCPRDPGVIQGNGPVIAPGWMWVDGD
jgi:hypothetical protein